MVSFKQRMWEDRKMSIDQKTLMTLSNMYKGEELIRGYDNFIQVYKIKHSNRLVNTLNKQEWFDRRDNVLERYVKRYYMRD